MKGGGDGLGVAPASPFLKWAGGKGQLLGQLTPLLPERFGRCIEPFVGGGAMFFHLHNLGRIACGALLNDANAELMDCYRVVQDAACLRELIERLRVHAGRVGDADYYYSVRAWDREPGSVGGASVPRAGQRRPAHRDCQPLALLRERGARTDELDRYSPVERAARTIFLNHTCYNGLYRLNSRGQFNVPYGKWSRPPRVFAEANLWACHRALQGVELRCEGFEACIEQARAGDFVYLDPPYDPLSATSSFTTYTGVEFRERDQERLAEAFRELDARGCLVLLSNSATPLIRRLYRGFRVDTLLAARAISSKADGRGKVEELAVRNYG